MLPQPCLAVRDLLVELVVVARGQLLLGLLLGRGRLGLLLGVVERLALLANVCLFLVGLALLRLSDDVGVVDPQLVRHPDWQSGRLGTLDVDALHVPPLLGNPLLHEGRHAGVDVVGDLLGSEVGVADADGGVGGGRKADQGSANGLLDLLGHGDGSFGIGRVLCLLALGALAVDFGGLGLQNDGDGALLSALEKGLAENLW